MTKQDSNSHEFWMQEDHTLIASALDLIDVPVVLVGKSDEEYTLIATNSRLRHFYEASLNKNVQNYRNYTLLLLYDNQLKCRTLTP